MAFKNKHYHNITRAQAGPTGTAKGYQVHSTSARVGRTHPNTPAS